MHRRETRDFDGWHIVFCCSAYNRIVLTKIAVQHLPKSRIYYTEKSSKNVALFSFKTQEFMLTDSIREQTFFLYKKFFIALFILLWTFFIITF